MKHCSIDPHVPYEAPATQQQTDLLFDGYDNGLGGLCVLL